MIFIYGCFFRLAKLLRGNNPTYSARLYTTFNLIGFTIPLIGFFTYKLGLHILWPILVITTLYMILMERLLYKTVIKKTADVYAKAGNKNVERLHSISVIIISIFLLFGPLILGFLALHALS